MNSFDASNIKILDVLTVNFSAISPIHKGVILTADDFRKFKFRTGYVTDINEEEEIVRILLDVEILGIVKGSKSVKKVGRITTESFFYLADFEDWVVEEFTEEGELRLLLTELMSSVLVGLAFSTTRGILLARASDTIIGNAILPVVAPQKLREMTEDDPYT